MGLITPDLSGIVDGAVGDAADWTTPFNTITNEVNGRLDTNNFTAAGTNLATIAQAVAWASWSPVYTGYSVNPTVSVAHYIQIGKIVIATLEHSAYGTSNTTALTLTLPIAAKSAQTLLGGRIRDNGGYSTTIGVLVTSAGSTVATAFRDMTGTAWTAANGKGLDFTIIYEAA